MEGHDITVIAEYLPGDESKDFTSPYAGGNFSCITGADLQTLAFDKYTYQNLSRLMSQLGGPEAGGLDRCYSTEFWDVRPPREKIDSLSSYLDEYQVIPEHKLPPGAVFGIKFKSWSFNCPVFLQNLQNYLLEKGVKFVRKKITHISQVYYYDTKVIFNCTGLGSFSLEGVKDTNMYPSRGQVLIVKAPHITENTMRWGKDYATYLIKRPYSCDQLVLGGFLQKDCWSSNCYKEQADDILTRTSKLVPELLTKNPRGNKLKDLEIIRSAAGLRPSRHGGVRIELQRIDGKLLIHNYGAGGYGYQAGLGMAEYAVLLVKDSKM